MGRYLSRTSKGTNLVPETLDGMSTRYASICLQLGLLAFDAAIPRSSVPHEDIVLFDDLKFCDVRPA